MLVSALLAGGCATTVATSGNVAIGGSHGSIGVNFTANDRRTIKNYYNEKRKHSGKSPESSELVKADQLSSSMQLVKLPPDLETKLTRIDKAYVRIIVGSDVVLIDKKSRVVIDIYRDVVV